MPGRINPLAGAPRPAHWGPDCAPGTGDQTLVLGGRGVLATRHDRRELLKWGAAALAALAAACAPAAPPTATPAPARPTEATAPAPTGKPGPVGTPVPRPTETSKAVEPTSPAAAAAQPAATEPAEAAKATAGGETVYVFNVGSKDVTLIDAASFKPLQTRPLGAQVRWLSNEQSYWDGQRIWTYDYPDNKLQAIAIDPREIAVTKTIAGLGTGPAHSLVVLPDGKKAAVNVAGDNLIAFLDLTSGQVDGTMTTGAFPWDLHVTPDGRFGYVPERDGDTVSKLDLARREIVKTVGSPAGSRPWMLRVSPDGKEVWVQTGAANTNVVLDAEDLKTLATEPCGKGPVTNAWSPDRKHSIVTNSGDSFAQVFDARTYKEVKRLNVGQGGSNIGFTRDGKTGFIAVTGADAVAVVDMARLELVEQVRAGTQPTGLIVR